MRLTALDDKTQKRDCRKLLGQQLKTGLKGGTQLFSYEQHCANSQGISKQRRGSGGLGFIADLYTLCFIWLCLY